MDARGAARYLSAVVSAMVANVYDPAIWRRAYPKPQALGPVIDYRENELSWFAESCTQLVGHELRPRFDVDLSSDCVDYIDEVTSVDEGAPPGFRVRGWAWGGQDVGRDGFVLFVKEMGNPPALPGGQ